MILKAMAMEFGENQWVTLSRDLLFRKSPMQCRDRWYKIKTELKLIPKPQDFQSAIRMELKKLNDIDPETPKMERPKFVLPPPKNSGYCDERIQLDHERQQHEKVCFPKTPLGELFHNYLYEKTPEMEIPNFKIQSYVSARLEERMARNRAARVFAARAKLKELVARNEAKELGDGVRDLRLY